MKLSVVAVQATDIPKMGFLTKTDPYLVMRLSSAPQEFRTNYIENTLNPVWNQRFEFTVNDRDTDQVIVVLKDWDTVDQHKIISKLLIPLRTIPIDKTNDMWFDMIPCTDKATGGRIRLLIQLTSGIKQPQAYQQPRPQLQIRIQPAMQQMQPVQRFRQTTTYLPYGIQPRAMPPPMPPRQPQYIQQGYYPQQGYGYQNIYPQQPAPPPQQYYGYTSMSAQRTAPYPGSPQTSSYYPGSPQVGYGIPPATPLATQYIAPAPDPYSSSKT